MIGSCKDATYRKGGRGVMARLASSMRFTLNRSTWPTKKTHQLSEIRLIGHCNI